MYGLKYFYEFTSVDGKHHRVEIREKIKVGDTGALELIALTSAFVVEYPKFDTYNVIRGCGASLNFIYKGSLEGLRALYTTDMTGFRVVHTIEDNINFIGYLDSENYEEDFAQNPLNGVNVELIANNGFSLLERIPYPEGAALINLADIVFDVIGLTGLDYQTLYFKSATTSEDISNMLADIFINPGNWIDEDGSELDCNEVLENVLKILCLTAYSIEDDIYIFDIETQLSETILFEAYDISTRARLTDYELNNIPIGLDAIEGIMNVKLTYDKIINNQKAVADTYTFPDLIDLEMWPIVKFNSLSQSLNHDVSVPWSEDRYAQHMNCERFSQAVDFVYERIDTGEEDFFISIDLDHSENISGTQLVNINTSTKRLGQFKKIGFSFDYMVRNREDYLNDDENKNIFLLGLNLKLTVGDKHVYRYRTDKYLRVSDNDYGLVLYPYSDIDITYNKWTSATWNNEAINYLISGAASLFGEVNLTIEGGITIEESRTSGEVSLANKELRIKNFKITAIDDIYDDIDDIEYEGIGDVNAKNKGKDIKCLCNSGYKPKDEDNYLGIPNLAQLLTYDWHGITYFKRGVNQGEHILEELLLGSAIGNNAGKNEILKLSCDYDNLSLINPIETSFIPGAKLVFWGGEIDYRKNEISMQLRKINPDAEL